MQQRQHHAACLAAVWSSTGMGWLNSRCRIAEVTDGTSNTVIVGERSFRFHNLNVGAGNALGFSSTVCTSGTSAGIKAAGMCVLGLAYNGINFSSTNRVHQPRGFHSNHVVAPSSCLLMVQFTSSARISTTTLHRTGTVGQRRLDRQYLRAADRQERWSTAW